LGPLGQRRNLSNAGPPLLCSGGDFNVAQTLMGGCKRLTSGHEIARTVSDVEAAIHCGDTLWRLSTLNVLERHILLIIQKNIFV